MCIIYVLSTLVQMLSLNGLFHNLTLKLHISFEELNTNKLHLNKAENNGSIQLKM